MDVVFLKLRGKMMIDSSKNKPFLNPRVGLMIVVFFLCCGIVSYMVSIRNCLFLSCIESRVFNVIELDIPPTFFPQDAIVGSIHRPTESWGAFESGSMTIYWENGNKGAGYGIYRFRTEQEASRNFHLEARKGKYSKDVETLYTSLVADEYFAGCGQIQGIGYRCNMAARYIEYSIDFTTSIDEEMTIEQFNKVLRFLDEQINEHLYKENS